jgi:hypothetical protein
MMEAMPALRMSGRMTMMTTSDRSKLWVAPQSGKSPGQKVWFTDTEFLSDFEIHEYDLRLWRYIYGGNLCVHS